VGLLPRLDKFTTVTWTELCAALEFSAAIPVTYQGTAKLFTVLVLNKKDNSVLLQSMNNSYLHATMEECPDSGYELRMELDAFMSFPAAPPLQLPLTGTWCGVPLRQVHGLMRERRMTNVYLPFVQEGTNETCYMSIYARNLMLREGTVRQFAGTLQVFRCVGEYHYLFPTPTE